MEPSPGTKEESGSCKEEQGEVLSWGDSGFKSQWAGEALQELGVFLGIVGSVALNLSSNTH